MKNKDTSCKQIIVSTEDLAKILSLTDRRIRQLEKEGSLVKVGRNEFDLAASIQKYVDVIKEKNKTDNELNKVHEELLLTQAKRQKAQLELEIKRNDLHKAEDIKIVFDDMCDYFRTQLLTVPDKVAPLLVDQREPEVIKTLMKKYINETLQDLAAYDPDAVTESR